MRSARMFATVLCVATLALPLPASADDDLKNEGVGLYTDVSVLGQTSTFTINRQMVSCGVGLGLSESGRSDMLMYSVDIQSYRVDRHGHTIQAAGTMRSITVLEGVNVEDARHDFLAVAVDGGPDGSGDRFDIHFKTPFWHAGSGCAPSDRVPEGCRFGGELLHGDVAIGP